MEVVRIGAIQSVKVVGISDMTTSADASQSIKTYSLGSCIGICAWDRIMKVGGLLHILLPLSSIQPAKAASHPYMFADTGIPRLFHALYDLGARKESIIVKIAGGADMRTSANLLKIGERNIVSTEEILHRNHVRIRAKEVGGYKSRTMTLQIKTGDVLIQSPGEEDLWI